MNKIIIDGYNMIHRVPQLSKYLERSLEKAREELIFLLKSYLTRSKVEIVLVFDGQGSLPDANDGRVRNRLEVMFSRHPFKADPLIKDLIRADDKKKSVTLVSDDSEITGFAESVGSQVLSPVDFYHRIEKRVYKNELHNKYDFDLTEEEISEWLEIFGQK